jgi:solute carrier family 25 folate transporter 32
MGRVSSIFIYSFQPSYSIISLSDGLSSILRTEGVAGLWRGTSLALFGVSNGAIQFMAYEEMKNWGFERKRKQFAKKSRIMTPEDDKLVSPNSLMTLPNFCSAL